MIRLPQRDRRQWAKVLVVDHQEPKVAAIGQNGTGNSEVPESRSVSYWFARMPLDVLQAHNPQGYGAYRKDPKLARVLTILSVPLLLGIVVFGIAFLVVSLKWNGAPMAARVGDAGLAGVFVGLFFGLPLASAIARRAFSTTILYVVGRVGDRLIWIVPPPLTLHAEGEGEGAGQLVEESEVLLWRLEELSLGINGWATENFLRGMNAARNRETELRGRGSSPLMVDRAHPAERGGANGAQT